MRLFVKKTIIFLFSIIFCIINYSSIKASTTLMYCYSSTCSINTNTLYKSSISSYGEVDGWAFTPTSSGYYVIETYGSMDMFMYTYDFGNIISNDDGGERWNSNIGFQADAGTEYTFFAKAYSLYSTGDYYIQVRNQQASIMTFDYGSGDINTNPDATTPMNELIGMGYVVYNYQNYSESSLNIDDSTGLNIFNKELSFFSGHGGKGVVALSDSNHNLSYLYSNELPYVGNIKLAVWASCESATNSATLNSMAEQSVINGARSAIGWPETITVLSSRTFTNNLYKRLADGYTVSQSASYAASKILWPWDNVKDYIIFGDANTIVNYGVNNKQNTVSYIPIYGYSSFQTLLDLDRIDSFGESVIVKSSSEGDYVVEFIGFTSDGDAIHRYHYMIDDIITNVFYDMTEEGEVINKSKFTMTNEEIQFFKNINAFDFDFSMRYFERLYYNLSIVEIEKHKVFIKDGHGVYPAMLFYITLGYSNSDMKMQDILCYNIQTGEKIEYENFSYNFD